MSLQVGDTLLGGKVVIVAVSNDLITSITFPSITDFYGTAVSVTFNPGLVQSDVEGLAASILGVLG
jgi:hypothetical protein